MKCLHETNTHLFLLLFEKEIDFVSFIIQLLETVKKLEHASVSITCKIWSCKTKIFFHALFPPSKFRTLILSRNDDIHKEQYRGGSAIGTAQSTAVL
jgi:hypothetical protein